MGQMGGDKWGFVASVFEGGGRMGPQIGLAPNEADCVKNEVFCKGLWRGGNDGKMGLLEGAGRENEYWKGLAGEMDQKGPCHDLFQHFSVQ